MTFLLDTDTLSNVMKRVPSHALLSRLATVPYERQFTTAVTVGEIAYGAHRSPRSEYFLRKLREQVLLNIRVLPFDRTAAEAYGQLRAQLERAGTPLAVPDLMIAAIALSRVMTVVTGNIRHFGKVPGLGVENWI